MSLVIRASVGSTASWCSTQSPKHHSSDTPGAGQTGFEVQVVHIQQEGGIQGQYRPPFARRCALLYFFLLNFRLFFLNHLFFNCLPFNKHLPQLTLTHILSSSLTLITSLPMRHHQHMQTVFVFIGHPDIQMRLRSLSTCILGPPTQQPGYPPDVRINRKAFPPQTEEKHTRSRLRADTLEGQHFFIRVVC